MGWGEKAIEVRSVQTGHLDGVFMHKKVQAFTFLCERNEKVCGKSTSIVKNALLLWKFASIVKNALFLRKSTIIAEKRIFWIC